MLLAQVGTDIVCTLTFHQLSQDVPMTVITVSTALQAKCVHRSKCLFSAITSHYRAGLYIINSSAPVWVGLSAVFALVCFCTSSPTGTT